MKIEKLSVIGTIYAYDLIFNNFILTVEAYKDSETMVFYTEDEEEFMELTLDNINKKNEKEFWNFILYNSHKILKRLMQ